MSRHGTYDPKYGFVPDDDCLQEAPKPTRADTIRSMEDSELAIFLYAKADGSGRTVEQWLDWLKQEVKDEDKA